jgi:hypothetical protein
MSTTQQAPPAPTTAASPAAAPIATAAPMATGAAASPATCSAPPCRLEGATLIVAPFAIRLHRQRYLSPSEIRIDLGAVAPGRYRVLAVHNFHVEDRNPCLDECVAGVFLAARRADGEWEEPERFPVECRALGTLAELAVPADGALPELRSP